jgi:predicted HAD superfamily Cof-like phosphohydrolase
MTTYQRVKEFHQAMGARHFESNDERAIDFRMKLILEEFFEVLDAAGVVLVDTFTGLPIRTEVHIERVEAPRPADLLKELADLDYVTAGCAEVFDWDFDEAGRRVHASNMSKMGDDGKPLRREDGKILKGPNYKPPHLGDLV